MFVSTAVIWYLVIKRLTSLKRRRDRIAWRNDLVNNPRASSPTFADCGSTIDTQGYATLEAAGKKATLCIYRNGDREIEEIVARSKRSETPSIGRGEIVDLQFNILLNVAHV